MSEFQVISDAKLKKLLEQRNLWSKMRSGKLLAIERNKAPAKIARGSTSYIISYYDKSSKNFLTVHRIVTKEGNTILKHVKDAYIDGIRYKARLSKKSI